MADLTFRIRDARKGDAAALGRLGALLVRMHHAWDPQRFFTWKEPIEPGYGRFLESETVNPNAVLVVTEGENAEGTTVVLGYAWGRLEQRDWAELLDVHGKLHDIVVDPDNRRVGLGTALVREVARGTLG